MNVPNQLTMSRIFLIPFFVAFLLMENVTSNLLAVMLFRWAALGVFVLAAITDYYDGKLARQYNLVTNFGRLFDPLADKLLTMSAFVAFVELRVPPDRPIFPAWAIIVILAREFLVTGLRSVATTQGKVIHADQWGKHKTVWQFISIITIVVVLCVRDSLRVAGIGLQPVDRWLPLGFGAMLGVVIAFTVASGIAFLVKNWEIISDRE